MKVLLCEDVERLGWLGDILEVKDGYARNYLLPQGLAIVPSEANIKALAKDKSKHTEARKSSREKLEQTAQATEGAEAVIAAKANKQGHLFGSVTQRDIAQNLRAQGFEVADEMVHLAEPIKEVGTHELTVKMAPDLTAKISVVVVSEDQSVGTADEDSDKQ